MAHDVFDHDHGAVDDHAEVQRAEREQIRGNLFQVETDGGEQQGKRNGGGDDESAADVAEKQEENDRDQDHAFRQVVQHGVAGEVDQVAAIDERNDLHARRQDVIVHLLDFFVERFESRIGGGAFAQQDDAETTSSLSMILPSSC